MSHISDALRSAFQDEIFTDLIIECNSVVFKAHRSVLIPQSGFFKSILTGNFSESSAQRIRLDDDEPLIVKTMLHYLYGMGVEECYYSSHSISKGLPGEETSAKARANMYSQLYIAGDKYDVPRMRELATGEFMATVENDWDEATFIPLIRSVFEGTASESNGLREGIIKATLRHIDVLEERQDFNHLLEDLPSFSHQLLQCVIMNAAKQKRGLESIADEVSLDFNKLTTVGDELPHNCSLCELSFNIKRNLQKHYVNFHRYCPLCDKYYRSAPTSRSHRHTMHGGADGEEMR